MPIVQQDVLRQLSFEIFNSTGIPADDARIVADHLVDNHLAGHDSHGTWFMPGYARSMKDNYVRWEDRQVVRENPSLVIIDGKGANGIVAVTRALDLAVEKPASPPSALSACTTSPTSAAWATIRHGLPRRA